LGPRGNIDPGNQGGIERKGGLDLVQRGDLSRQGTVGLNQLGVELAEGDAGQFALVLQVLEPLGPLGFVEILGRAFHQPIELIQIRRAARRRREADAGDYDAGPTANSLTGGKNRSLVG
jgi:hypothetical protein